MLSFDFHMHGLFFPLSFGVFDDDQDVVVGLLSDWFFFFLYFWEVRVSWYEFDNI